MHVMCKGNETQINKNKNTTKKPKKPKMRKQTNPLETRMKNTHTKKLLYSYTCIFTKYINKYIYMIVIYDV